MADAIVEFLLVNLKELLLYHVDLISGVKDQVESLHKELSLMKAFLKDSREKRNESEYVRESVRQITAVAYKAEDIIDTFVVNEASKKRRGVKKMIPGFGNKNLLNLAKDIESIKTTVKEIYDKKMCGIESLQNGEPSRRSARQKREPFVEDENVVGFDEEARTIIDRLTEGSEQLEIVSVVGMGGLGKTTLARKVYSDPRIEYHFYLRAWTYVSQEYSRREVFLGILESLNLNFDQMYKMSDEKLAEELCKHLRNNKYLIVIDDVWTKEAWDDLRRAFPKTKLGSRILLTSRNTEVAKLADPYSHPHHLRFLTEEESWELLCRKVFGRGSCPSELENLGKIIATKCCGLPLAIVVISGLLIKKDKNRDWWRKVAESVSSYVAKDPKQCMDVLALSYRHLPEHLKICFLYFGVFPEDYEIPVWKLLRLWAAEGFIQETEHEDLEDTAEDYLEDLVDRNLVLVGKRRANGRIKTCRIHDMLRDLCLREGKDDKFLQVIKSSEQNPFLSTPFENDCRRLCIHSKILEFISSKPSYPYVRSFLCFATEEMDLPRRDTSSIYEAFELLRVLDLRPICFPLFPKELDHLVHLRFIVLFGQFKKIPSQISSLWNLQTLIVRTTSRDLDIEANIWKMKQFRHLYVTGLSRLSGPLAQTRRDNEDPFVRSNIKTISTILPDSCTENVLARTPGLKKLGIRGRLAKLMEIRGGSSLFDNLSKLGKLETLKLLNDTYPEPPAHCVVPGLPQHYKFPPNLKKLTLSDTLLDWGHMSTLGVLPNLEVLKLKDNAFEGSHWKPLDGGFRLLKVLQIGKTNLVRWDALGHHFPKLQSVVLKHCTSLVAIPSGLGEVSVLQNMELYWPTKTAVVSARVIHQQKLQLQSKQQQVNNLFKLVIYPPDC
ncbi:putative late blight resistance protein homolog R1A-10 [Olea europaea var. sylvestris]|uniref:putative late blight resistance protein homolog R1A-10 n=1 Tax=Olea europaea var. sylvestris TaxID=158386 RepID=UPI000C1D1EA6|nr:putative late blight resistance protein homolog R1A-10 [Olea europaea var. sylvestris]